MQISIENVSLKEFIEGTLTKYINNTGEICSNVFSEISSKAEAFVHLTYVNSDEHLLELCPP